MAKSTDVRVVATALHFLEVTNRIPLKFGPETTTEVTCARVRVRVADRSGRTADGWGETPLNVQWVWPSSLPYAVRHERLKAFLLPTRRRLGEISRGRPPGGGGYDFKEHRLGGLRGRGGPGGRGQRAHAHTRRAGVLLPFRRRPARRLRSAPRPAGLRDVHGGAHEPGPRGVPHAGGRNPRLLHGKIPEGLPGVRATVASARMASRGRPGPPGCVGAHRQGAG